MTLFGRRIWRHLARRAARPRVSVVIPTHEHAATLPYAVRSVQAQGVEDIEILICGDGVTTEVRAAVDGLQRADPRIRFFDLPKAPSIGELNRDIVVREAKGEIICYQSDDDLWLPGHIADLEEALAEADFAGGMQVDVEPGDKVRTWFFDLEHPEFAEPWREWRDPKFGAWANEGFGIAFAAHRLDAYLRLPEGWATRAEGYPADQMLWHKFSRQSWCRTKFLRWPIALHFADRPRHAWSAEQRAEEARRWTAIIERPDFAQRIWRELLPDLGDRLLQEALESRRNG